MRDDQIFQACESVRTPLQSRMNPPCRILVVDDDPYICHLSAEALIRHGYEVNAAEDGVSGWEELRANNYKLLIAEHALPKVTGIELVRAVRAARMALPVVMVAKKLPAQELARNPSLQLAAMLLKPFAVDALLDTVKNVLRADDSAREQIVPPPIWRSQPAAAGLRV